MTQARASADAEIREYLRCELDDEVVERIAHVGGRRVYGQLHEIWEVVTDAAAYWVVSEPLLNVYRRDEVPTADIALSVHVGAMMRMNDRSRAEVTRADLEYAPTAHRRLRQARDAVERAVEPEEFQFAGMRCREALVVLAQEVRVHFGIPLAPDSPKQADFTGWCCQIFAEALPGGRFERQRKYARTNAEQCWEVVQETTHRIGCTYEDAEFAVHATNQVFDTLLNHCINREAETEAENCPVCGSFQIALRFLGRNTEPDKSYSTHCDQCGWKSEPHAPPRPGMADVVHHIVRPISADMGERLA